MSDPATLAAPTRIEEVAPLGMISLRAAPDTPGLAAAVKAVAGTGLPGQRGILMSADRAAAWMSPDEWLLVLPHAGVHNALKEIEKEFGSAHFLAADVSDARAVFRITGPGAEGVIARLCPVDLRHLPKGELRRTRAAQVACALWRIEDGFTLVAFRSVGRYMRDLLTNALQ